MTSKITQAKLRKIIRESFSPNYDFEMHLVDDIHAALMILTNDESALSNREGYYYKWDTKLFRAIADLNSIVDLIERKRERGR